MVTAAIWTLVGIMFILKLLGATLERLFLIGGAGILLLSVIDLKMAMYVLFIFIFIAVAYLVLNSIGTKK